MKRRYFLICLSAVCILLSGVTGQLRHASAQPTCEVNETKVYCHATIDQDFDDESVLVVLDKQTGGINKQFDHNFFGNLEIAAIEDLTYISGDINNCKYLDREAYGKFYS